ncbi:MAG: hypothetical protein ACRD6N_10370 [Pyrinomonadaceae bacterium]
MIDDCRLFGVRRQSEAATALWIIVRLRAAQQATEIQSGVALHFATALQRDSTIVNRQLAIGNHPLYSVPLSLIP